MRTAASTRLTSMQSKILIVDDNPDMIRLMGRILSSMGQLRFAELMEQLTLGRPVLVSPSMSGGYSLPLVARHPDKLCGFVAVAPVRISRYEPELVGNQLPTLALWGSDDRIVPLEQAERLVRALPNARLVVLEDAGHACYLQATAEFHRHLIQFVAACTV